MHREEGRPHEGTQLLPSHLSNPNAVRPPVPFVSVSRNQRVVFLWTRNVVVALVFMSLGAMMERYGHARSASIHPQSPVSVGSKEQQFQPASKETESGLRDDTIHQWDVWQQLHNQGRGHAEEQKRTRSLFLKHVALATKLIDWETLDDNVQSYWKPPDVEHPMSDEMGKRNSVGQDASEQWGLFCQKVHEMKAHSEESTAADSSSLFNNVTREDWWRNMSTWFRHTWTTHANEAHELWSKLQQQASTTQLVVSYNVPTRATREKEEQLLWYASTITNLRLLGQNMRTWWNHNSAAAQVVQEQGETNTDESSIHDKFEHWWDQESHNARLWWKQTRLAFANFSDDAVNKEHLWWHMIQDAASNGWNETKKNSHHAWDQVKSESQRGWNAMEQEVVLDAKEAWNATVESEEQMWNAMRKWFHAHATYSEELDQPLLYLNNTRAFGMLMNGYGWYDYSRDFFFLQKGWDAQINQAYCAVASCAAVLNSLHAIVEPPIDPMYDPYPYATQLGLLQNNPTCINQNVVRYNATFDGIWHPPGGISLHQAKNLLECYLPADEFLVSVHELDPATLELDEVRKELTEALQDPLSRVIINFDRSALDQSGRGHFSPLASYSPTEDRFLILDVAKYKYPAVWVSAARLVTSMARIDHCGYSNVPQAQDGLPPDDSDAFTNQTLYLQLTHEMGCEPRYRGYILVRPNVSSF